MSTNLVVFSGRLGKDPEIRQTAGNKTVAGFSLAVTDGWGHNQTTMWVNVETWEKTAEAVGRLLVKGSRAIVTGRLKEDTWESNGEKKSRFKVVAEKVEVIDFPETEKVTDDDQIPF